MRTGYTKSQSNATEKTTGIDRKEKILHPGHHPGWLKLSGTLAPLLASLLAIPLAPAQPASPENEVQVLQDMIRKAPRVASNWKNYGLALLRARSPQEAASAFATSCRLGPDEIDACYLSGRTLLSLDMTRSWYATPGGQQGLLSPVTVVEITGRNAGWGTTAPAVARQDTKK
jgi:hypothetical protein